MNNSTDTEFELIDTIETACVELDCAMAVLSQVLEDYFSDDETEKLLSFYADNISKLLNAVDSLLRGTKHMLQDRIPI
ncbi:MAG: hypothetical protein IJJ99_03015 [Oscillospiraceae bacterium]|nr:hypothetical protein [Oscillospiraceae bacterium]